MKHNRVREVSMEVTVGAFMFMVLLALAVFTIILSRQSFLQKTYFYEVTFDEILGLREGDNIYLRGVAQGKIRKITLGDRDVVVRMGLDRELKLHEDYRMEIVASSVFGGRVLHIFEGSETAPRLAGGTPLRGVMPVDLIEQATRTVHMIKTTLDEGGMLENLRSGSERLNAILGRIDRGEGSVGKLLTEDAVYNDIKAITDNLKSVSDQIARGQGTLGKFLADDGRMYYDVAQVVTNLEVATRNLSEGKGLLGKLLSEDETLYNDLRESAAAIRDLTTSLNEGQGTLGKLVRDDELYEDAKLLLKELHATIDDFRETAPITTFTSVLFGAF